MLTEQNKEALKSIAEDVRFDEPMKLHTTFRIGGNADAYINAGSPEEIIAVKKYCAENNIPYMFVGNGSNILVRDEGIRGAVISIGNKMSDIRVEGSLIYAGAGAMMSKAASEALKAGLTGYEALAGIPGTIGGAVFMNAGAYGTEIKDVLKYAVCVTKDNEIVQIPAEELELSYRHSILADTGAVVTSVCFELKPGNEAEIRDAMKDYAQRRKDKQPLEYPSAGSTFKRPAGYFAGKLIEDSGLKGYTVGGAMISEKHAGFVINKGGATANDVITLINDAARIVKEKTGVDIEPEVRIIS